MEERVDDEEGNNSFRSIFVQPSDESSFADISNESEFYLTNRKQPR